MKASWSLWLVPHDPWSSEPKWGSRAVRPPTQKAPKKNTSAEPAPCARAAPIRRRLGNYQTASPRHRLLPPLPSPPPSPPPPLPRVYNLVRPQPGCLKLNRCGQVNKLTFLSSLRLKGGTLRPAYPRAQPARTGVRSEPPHPAERTNKNTACSHGSGGLSDFPHLSPGSR